MKKIILSGLIALASGIAVANDQPEFPGGNEALQNFIKENVKYPDVAKENGIEGIVAVGFLVDVDGSLQNIKVIKYIDPDLEKEAVRVVTIMPAWIPAEKEGTPVQAPAKVDIPFLME